MAHRKRAVDPYIVPVADDEMAAYHQLRIRAGRARARRRRPRRIPTCRSSIKPRAPPVVVDEEKCIADKGCRVCVDVCPLDILAIDE